MRGLGLAGLFAFSGASMAQAPIWVGPDCLISWDHNPAAELVQGYNVHVRNTSGPVVSVDSNVGYVNEATCSALSLAQGRYEVWVTAYNPVGESDPSDVLPFVLVTGAPGTPAVTAPANLSIESAGGT